MSTSASVRPETESMENEFLFLVYDLAQLIRRHADTRARDVGMTRAQWAVLAKLERNPGITQNALAQLSEVEPITAGRLVDRLEASGYVERQADPTDRRVWRLRLTDKSGELLKEIHKFRAELQTQMSEGIDPETGAVLIGGLKRIRANLSQTKDYRSNKKDATS